MDAILHVNDSATFCNTQYSSTMLDIQRCLLVPSQQLRSLDKILDLPSIKVYLRHFLKLVRSNLCIRAIAGQETCPDLSTSILAEPRILDC